MLPTLCSDIRSTGKGSQHKDKIGNNQRQDGCAIFNGMKPSIHIASCSFGKDSIATILLALENGEPLDRVVFAEVMFDHSRGISGELPEHIEWVYSTAIPKLESMGVKVDVVRAERDYVYFFANAVRGGEI